MKMHPYHSGKSIAIANQRDDIGTSVLWQQLQPVVEIIYPKEQMLPTHPSIPFIDYLHATLRSRKHCRQWITFLVITDRPVTYLPAGVIFGVQE